MSELTFVSRPLAPAPASSGAGHGRFPGKFQRAVVGIGWSIGRSVGWSINRAVFQSVGRQGPKFSRSSRSVSQSASMMKGDDDNVHTYLVSIFALNLSTRSYKKENSWDKNNTQRTIRNAAPGTSRNG